MSRNQANTEKLYDLKSFKRLSPLIPPKSAGGALNLTRELHELVAEDISCLEQERDSDTILKLYKFIVDSLNQLESETSGGVKGFISASLDYWQKKFKKKERELAVMKKRGASLQVPRRFTPDPEINRSDPRQKREKRKKPWVSGGNPTKQLSKSKLFSSEKVKKQKPKSGTISAQTRLTLSSKQLLTKE